MTVTVNGWGTRMLAPTRCTEHDQISSITRNVAPADGIRLLQFTCGWEQCGRGLGWEFQNGQEVRWGEGNCDDPYTIRMMQDATANQDRKDRVANHYGSMFAFVMLVLLCSMLTSVLAHLVWPGQSGYIFLGTWGVGSLAVVVWEWRWRRSRIAS